MSELGVSKGDFSPFVRRKTRRPPYGVMTPLPLPRHRYMPTCGYALPVRDHWPQGKRERGGEPPLSPLWGLWLGIV